MTEEEKLKGFVGEYRTSIGTNWSAGDKGRIINVPAESTLKVEDTDQETGRVLINFGNEIGWYYPSWVENHVAKGDFIKVE